MAVDKGVIIEPWIFFLAAISVWSLARMLIREDGPFFLFLRFRNLVGVVEDEEGDLQPTNQFATFFVCPLCLSVWLAIPFTLILGGGLLEWLAISGVARFLLRISEK